MKWVLIVLYLDLAGAPHVAATAEFDSFQACESAAQAQVKAAKDRKTFDVQVTCTSKGSVQVPSEPKKPEPADRRLGLHPITRSREERTIHPARPTAPGQGPRHARLIEKLFR